MFSEFGIVGTVHSNLERGGSQCELRKQWAGSKITLHHGGDRGEAREKNSIYFYHLSLINYIFVISMKLSR